MVLVDTSVLVALLQADHSKHRAARKGLQEVPTIVIPSGVLAEFAQAWRRIANLEGLDGSKVARTSISEIMALQGVRLVKDYDDRAAMALYQKHPSLSYVDAWGIQAALDRNEDLLTFDARQKRIWNQHRSK